MGHPLKLCPGKCLTPPALVPAPWTQAPAGCGAEPVCMRLAQEGEAGRSCSWRPRPGAQQEAKPQGLLPTETRKSPTPRPTRRPHPQPGPAAAGSTPAQATAPGARRTWPAPHSSTTEFNPTWRRTNLTYDTRGFLVGTGSFIHLHSCPLNPSLKLCRDRCGCQLWRKKGGSAGPGDRVRDQGLSDFPRTPLTADQTAGQWVEKLGPAHLVGSYLAGGSAYLLDSLLPSPSSHPQTSLQPRWQPPSIPSFPFQ